MLVHYGDVFFFFNIALSAPLCVSFDHREANASPTLQEDFLTPRCTRSQDCAEEVNGVKCDYFNINCNYKINNVPL